MTGEVILAEKEDVVLVRGLFHPRKILLAKTSMQGGSQGPAKVFGFCSRRFNLRICGNFHTGIYNFHAM